MRSLRSPLASLSYMKLCLCGYWRARTGQGGQCPCSAGLIWIPTPISSLQAPQLAVPGGCRNRPGAKVKKHLVLVRMLSCRCQAHTSKTVLLGKILNLSGAAYDLDVLAETRFGRSTIQKWPLPAQELPGARVVGTGAREAGSTLR